MPDLDELKARAGSRGALHGCSSDPCGSVVCQTARDRDALLVELERVDSGLRELHRPVVVVLGLVEARWGDAAPPDAERVEQCTVCKVAFPCPTVALIGEGSEVGCG